MSVNRPCTTRIRTTELIQGATQRRQASLVLRYVQARTLGLL
jgi:hypothetical protein